MAKRTRYGNVTLTLEMPIEVAEWFSANGELFGHAARIATAKTQHASATSQQQREEYREKRKTELLDLGRAGYRPPSPEAIITMDERQINAPLQYCNHADTYQS